MAHYGALSPKRTKVFSNSKKIGYLCQGPLTKTQKEKCTLKTTIKTKSGGYQGSKDLKSTQILGCKGVPRSVCNSLRLFAKIWEINVAPPVLKPVLEFSKVKKSTY